MSEYQYYDFLAIDRRLTSEEMSTLRNISSRAHITPARLTNVYNFGDFKGNPSKLVLSYFDVHVYWANWGAAVFMISLPLEAISGETAEAVQMMGFLELKDTPNHWVITWSLGDEPEDLDRFVMDGGEDWMQRLAPIREELLRGDLRSLYIGWLAAVTKEECDDNDLEPLALEGLDCLTLAQQDLAEFLEVDPDLLAGAGMGRSSLKEPELKEQMIEDWLNTLPQKEMKDILSLLLTDQGREAERRCNTKFASWQNCSSQVQNDIGVRSVAEIHKNSETARSVRLQKEKQEQKRREEKRLQKRQTYLKELASDFSKTWENIQNIVSRGSGSAYDEACQVLVDLCEAYVLYSGPERFQQDLNQFMQGHMRRKALIQRLVRVGLLNQDMQAKNPTG